jgi:hypothetical protein
MRAVDSLPGLGSHVTVVVTGPHRQIAVDFDSITLLRRYLIQDLEASVNIELVSPPKHSRSSRQLMDCKLRRLASI